MNNIKRQFKGNVGIFLVCAELSRRNLIALPTSRNTEGYDIVSLQPDTNVATGIQVKCTDKKDFPVLSTYWRDYEQVIQDRIRCPFVFVDISNFDKPRYFILSANETRQLLNEIIVSYATEFGKRQGLTWEKILEQEQREERRRHQWAIRLDKFEVYENHWGSISGVVEVDMP